MKRNAKPESFRAFEYLACAAALVLVLLLCVCVGSVNLPAGQTLSTILDSVLGRDVADATAKSLIMSVRLPRVLCVALVGAALSVAGAALQGLLRNPLADGATLGFSAGACLGAAIAIFFGLSITWLPFGATTVMAVVFAFLSMLLILSLAYKLDYSLATNTIILIGVIFTMFINAILSFVLTFAGDKLKSITFWTMGSLAGTGYLDVVTLLVVLVVFGGVLLLHARELNAFAIGEDNARNIGVNVRRVKLTVLIAVAALIGVCVSIGGSIGFVGLVMPHMTRMVVGPNHKRLLPATLFSGAVFLALADLVARTLMKPLELPIGVITAFIGSIVFVYIFYSQRKGR